MPEPGCSVYLATPRAQHWSGTSAFDTEDDMHTTVTSGPGPGTSLAT